MALVVKNLPANAGYVKDRLRSLHQEDPMEEGMATHSSILAWRIPWTEEPGRLSSMGSRRVGHNWSSLAHSHTYIPLETSFCPTPHPTYLGRPRALACTPCAGQQLRASYFTHGSHKSMLLSSSFDLLSPPPPCPYVCSLHLHLYS